MKPHKYRDASGLQYAQCPTCLTRFYRFDGEPVGEHLKRLLQHQTKEAPNDI
jgi:hypothetical protein